MERKPMKMKVVRLPENVVERIKTIAQTTRRSDSEVIRNCLDDHLPKLKKHQQSS